MIPVSRAILVTATLAALTVPQAVAPPATLGQEYPIAPVQVYEWDNSMAQTNWGRIESIRRTADTLTRMGQHQPAIELLTRALREHHEVDRSRADLYVALAEVRTKAGDLSGAM